jgi:peroxiredoxin
VNKKIKIVSIANDSIRLLKKMKEEHKFSMDIIADKGARIAKDYNVYWFAPGGGGSLNLKQAFPSKFLINKVGSIVWTYIGKDKADRPSIELMMEAINKKLINPFE